MQRLHPRLARLLVEQGWSGLTAVQEQAWPALRQGGHVLVVAPTGHGKTEAALLPVLSRILEERDRLETAGQPWPAGFKAIYVTPLRALNRDLMGRMESWAEPLGLRIGVRHGDTTQAERARQSRDPPDLLFTTPETLQLLLYGDTLRRHLATVRFVILDEVHDLAASERGAQLLVALERVEEVVGQPAALRAAPAKERLCPAKHHARAGGGFQRIGLSATVADPSAIARWLGGARPVAVARVEAQKRIDLAVALPCVEPGDAATASRLSLPPAALAHVRAVRALVAAHTKTLVFQNTRDGAELLASRSALLDTEAGQPPLLGLHHGSLSAEHRADVEERFKRGDLRGVVATSSLELGIDVGAIDHVVQVSSPRSVARLVQRLGRSGHRVDAVSAGTLLATGVEDAWECAAVARRAKEGRLEPLVLRDAPLVVVANQLAALANEYADLRRDWTFGLLRRAGAFLDLDEALFDAAWQAMLDAKTLFATEGKADRIARGGRARKHFLDHISLIADEATYRVVDAATQRSIGTVDAAFVAASLAPGSTAVLAGQSWRVVEVDAEAHKVRVAPVAELGPIPQWTGSQLPVSYEVAQEVARLRRALAERDAKELARYPLPEDLAAPVAGHQEKGLQVAHDRLVTLEVEGRTCVMTTCLGTRGNETLGRLTQGLLAQELGEPVGVESDAYRIHVTFQNAASPERIAACWNALQPKGLDTLLFLLLRDHPQLRYHLVQVAQQFGALPKDLEPAAMRRGRLDALLEQVALQEETLNRLLHERYDLAAVRALLHRLRSGETTLVVQGVGPLTHLGRDEMRRNLAAPRDDAVLAAVRERIEAADVLLACCACAATRSTTVADLPRRIACRRCTSNQVAVLRPWNEDQVPLLRNKGTLSAEQAAERARMQRNGALVAGFGGAAARLLVARGIGPDTAARILQKAGDPANPLFWRELLEAELTFARTSAFWAR